MNFWKIFFACVSAIFVAGIFNFIMTIIIISGIISGLSSTSISDNNEIVSYAKNTVLELDMSNLISETPSNNIIEDIDFTTLKITRSTTIYNLVQAINRAAIDPNIAGISIKASLNSRVSSDIIYQLRQALEKFKSSQKFILAYGDAYTQSQYWLSSVADKVYLNPAGAIEWKGLSSSVMFYKELLEKIGVEPIIFRHGSYKSALEPFVRDEMSPENKEQMQSVINSMWKQIITDVSQARAIRPTTLNQIANKLQLFDANDAVDKRVADELLYEEQYDKKLATMTADSTAQKANVINLHRYANKIRDSYVYENQIAILYAEGTITNAGKEGVISTKLRREISELADNDNIKAVVLRVNSPGGGTLASEIIRYAVAELKKKKPVVVSMGQYAASGGYWISCDADYIVASPLTITGSIGVFGLTFNVQKGANDILGISVDGVKTNPYANSMQDMFQEMTPFAKAYIQRGVDSVYVNFVKIVARGRNLPYDDVDNIASGRIWSGTQALKLDLIDKVGSLNDAIEKAAQLARVEDDYKVSQYPKNKNRGILNLINESFSIVKTNLLLAQNPRTIAMQKIQQINKIGPIQARIPYQITIE